MSAITDRILARLRRRKAYAQCFLDDDGNLTPAARAVMTDLAHFCRVYRSTAIVSPVSRSVDTHASMLAEGRREVWNRVFSILRITDDQILGERQESTDE
ncbi:hypothetical protein [Paraburkholderia sp. SIMBA_027]|uniref:Bbp19 family protein n=1 Tax=Paraburkholderia sp. SIMBA_027 TaxID=3085770 RepID=UPI003979FA3C